jgi:spore germination protein KC
MNNRPVKRLLIVAILLLLTGCWDRREMNELGIDLGMGIDKSDNEYVVSVQAANVGQVASNKNGDGARATVTLFRSTGKTIMEALGKITLESSRKPYLSHLRLLIIGEGLAREGIGEALDFISRDREFRTDFGIVVARGSSAEKVLDVVVPIDKIPANQMFNSLRISDKYLAPTISVTLDKLILDIISQGKDPVLTGLQVFGDTERGGSIHNAQRIKPETSVKSTGLAIVKGDRLVGWLDDMKSKSYSYITDEVNNTIDQIKCPDGGNIALEIIRTRTKMKGEIVGGKPVIRLNVKTEANIGEVQCKVDLYKAETIKELEIVAEKTLRSHLGQTISLLQNEYKSDIFGFGEAIHRSNPKAWKKLKMDWSNSFETVSTDIKVDVQIRRTGTVTNRFIK